MIERVIPVLEVGPFGCAILSEGVKEFSDNETNGKVLGYSMRGGEIGGCDVSLLLNVPWPFIWRIMVLTADFKHGVLIGLYFALWKEGRSGIKWGPPVLNLWAPGLEFSALNAYLRPLSLINV
jgi:hypothetical protein